MNFFTKHENGYFVCICCGTMTWHPEEHRCDGIRKETIRMLLKSATNDIRLLTDRLPINLREHALREATKIENDLEKVLSEQWDKDK